MSINPSSLSAYKYYRIYNEAYANMTMEIGYEATPGPLQFLPNATYSSENWQLFPENGVFFLRNYDYTTSYQLGVNETNTSQVLMLPISGARSQQWTIQAWTGSNAGYAKFANVYAGSSLVLSVTQDADLGPVPVMAGAETNNAHWTWDINYSVSPSGGMLAPVSGFEAVSSSSSVSSTATSTPSSTSPTSSTGTQSQIATPTPTPEPSLQSHSLSGGAIAGIIIGAIAIILAIVGFFILRRRRSRVQKTQNGAVYEPPVENTTHKQNGAGFSSPTPTAEHGGFYGPEKGTGGMDALTTPVKGTGQQRVAELSTQNDRAHPAMAELPARRI